MENENEKEITNLTDSRFRDEIHSKVVRAGKRTYFLDVKCTRNDEYYLTITESKKFQDEKGDFRYEKHKIFLYQEDFEKFSEALSEITEFIRTKQENTTESQ